jgi:hypothetical protein
MNANTQTVKTDSKSGGISGALRSSLQMGLGVAESVHQFAVEIPLSMVPGFVASKEQTTALKDKHRNLLRGVYGSIGSLATSMIDAGAQQAELAVDEAGDLAEAVEAKLAGSKKEAKASSKS